MYLVEVPIGRILEHSGTFWNTLEYLSYECCNQSTVIEAQGFGYCDILATD